MIYLDNAATTWPKPPSVARAVRDAINIFGANPGRGGYSMAENTDDMLFRCRKKAAAFFGCSSPEQVIFTPGCTYSLNCVINGIVPSGGHVIISDLEHNAVVRPLSALSQRGVTVSRAKVYENEPEKTLQSFRSLIQRNTCMIVATHVSNVSGVRLPVEAIGRLCREHGLIFCVDAAQSAGTLNVNAKALNADFICAPAHKGLYGIMGLGLMIIAGKNMPFPLITGGTGSASSSRRQPEALPDRYESGTLNVPGICALSAGIDFVSSITSEILCPAELELMQQLYDELSTFGGIQLYTLRPSLPYHAPLLSFNVGDLPSARAGELLAEKGIAVRTGYHCAYDAHLALGTSDRGTVRVCPSAFNTSKDIDLLLDAVYRILKNQA